MAACDHCQHAIALESLQHDGPSRVHLSNWSPTADMLRLQFHDHAASLAAAKARASDLLPIWYCGKALAAEQRAAAGKAVAALDRRVGLSWLVVSFRAPPAQPVSTAFGTHPGL